MGDTKVEAIVNKVAGIFLKKMFDFTAIIDGKDNTILVLHNQLFGEYKNNRSDGVFLEMARKCLWAKEQEEFIKNTAISHVKEQLKKEQMYVFVASFLKEGENGREECRKVISFYRIEPEEETIVCVIKDETNEYRKERQLSHALMEEARYREALVRDSKCVYLFDLDKGIITEDCFFYSWDEQQKKQMEKKGMALPIEFDDLMKRWIRYSGVVFDEESFREKLNCYHLRKMFQNGQQSISCDYFEESTQTYNRLSMVLTKDENTGCTTVCVIIKDITAEQKKTEIGDAFQVLTKLYWKIMRVNLNTQEFSYIRNIDRQNGAEKEAFFRNVRKEWEAFVYNSDIHGEDEAKLMNLMDISYLRTKFSGECDYLQEKFRRKENGQYIWHMVEVMRDQAYTENKPVLLITMRSIHGLEAETLELERRYQDFLNVMGKSNVSEVYINFEKDSFFTFKMDSRYQHLLPSMGLWDQMVAMYAKHVLKEESREVFEEKFCSEYLKEHLSENKDVEMDCEVNSTEGVKYYRLTAMMSDRNEEGEIRHGLFVARDVTSVIQEEEKHKALKKAHMDLEEAHKALEIAYAAAEDANAAKTDFLSRMSHDIRTPMNAIIGMTTIAEKNIEDKDKIQDCLHKINISSQHLLGLINDVLDMSKIESGKMTLNEEELNIEKILYELEEIVRPNVTAKHHTMTINTEQVRHPEVIADPLRLQQIFVNLVSNAVKYTPDGGTISITVRERPGEQEQIGHYEFEFKDNGIGMSEEFLSRLFVPFERERDERVNKEQGTGLGMAITNNIVKMMNGNMEVESELGKGSTFTVLLSFRQLYQQVEEETQEENATVEEKEVNIEGKHILLVEDIDVNREIANEILEMLGLEVTAAVDGKDALEQFEASKEGAFDLILMDVQMPNMNGYESTKAIRSLEREDAKEIPIIAMTANAFVEDIQDAKRAGMNDHLAKPINMGKLMEMLQKWLCGCV